VILVRSAQITLHAVVITPYDDYR